MPRRPVRTTLLVLLAFAAPAFAAPVRIFAVGNKLCYVVWEDDRNGTSDVYLARRACGAP